MLKISATIVSMIRETSRLATLAAFPFVYEEFYQKVIFPIVEPLFLNEVRVLFYCVCVSPLPNDFL